MTPEARIQQEIKVALKAGEKERLGVLRMLLAEIKNARVDKKQADIEEDEFLVIVKRLVKQRRESADSYRDGDRPELADKEDREREILEAYLPQQASEAEIRAVVEEIVAEEGLSGPRAMGPVMQKAMARFGAGADGATVSRIAREVLAG